MDFSNIVNLKDDPLQFLMRYSYDIFLHPLYICCAVFSIILLGCVLFVHIYDSFKAGNMEILLNYGPSFFVILYGFCALIFTLMKVFYGMERMKEMKKNSIDICNCDEHFNKKIKKQFWYLKQIVNIHMCLTIVAALSICSVIEDRYHIFYAITFIREHYPQHEFILTLIFHFTLLIMTICMSYTSYCVCYPAFLGYMQLKIFIYMLTNIEDGFHRRWDTDESLLVDRYYQNSIYYRLKLIAKKTMLLKRFISELNAWFEVSISLFAFLGLLLAISLMMYTLHSENTLPTSHYPRLFLLCCVSGLTAIIFTGSGELIKNESEIYLTKLYNVKWFRWDRRNKQIYLILMLFMLEPLTIESFGILVLDLNLVVKICSKAYSTAAVLATFRNSPN